jgi:hypothetical protein
MYSCRHISIQGEKCGSYWVTQTIHRPSCFVFWNQLHALRCSTFRPLPSRHCNILQLRSKFTGPNESLPLLQHARCPQPCSWRFKYSGMWHHILLRVVTAVYHQNRPIQKKKTRLLEPEEALPVFFFEAPLASRQLIRRNFPEEYEFPNFTFPITCIIIHLLQLTPTDAHSFLKN